MGVTGERAALGRRGRAAVVGRIRAVTDLPVCVGIGVSTPPRRSRSAGWPTGWWSARPWSAGCWRAAGSEAAAGFVGELRVALDRS